MNTQTNTIGNKEYRLTSTGNNSAKFGNCECCGKHVSDVYIMSALQSFSYIHNGKEIGGKKAINLPYQFGHKECLLSVQK